MRSGDKILIIVLIVLAISYFAFKYFGTDNSDHALVARISQNGKVVKEIPLNEDNAGEYTFKWNGHYNTILVTAKSVKVKAADCHNQLCVKQGEIDTAGQSIICLPHRFVVELISQKSEVDSIVR